MSNGAAVEPTPAVVAAYEELIVSFARFMATVNVANELGIDVGAAIGQSLTQTMTAEELDTVPAYLRMALGI